MLDLIQITNDPAFARRCDALAGMRLFVDLERLGKSERQAGRDTYISAHAIADVGRIRSAVRRSRLMVRTNPLNEDSAAEVDAVLAEGADLLMLPMFGHSDEMRKYAELVGGRVPIVALLETAGALDTLPDWLDTPGLEEVFVGLNDLHIALGHRFMFEPLAQGMLDVVARQVLGRGLRFGFGGIARLEGGLLPGRDVLAEHLRLGSGSVILSRAFLAGVDLVDYEAAVAALRRAESELTLRPLPQLESDRVRIAEAIAGIARDMPVRT